MILLIALSPEQPELPSVPTVIDLDITNLTEYTTNSAPNADSYYWELSPVAAGTIEGTDTIGTAYWNNDYTGLVAQVFVQALNNYCDPVYSETLEIGLSLVNVLNPEGQEMEITIAPNPSSGKFNVKVVGATDDIELIIINSTGQKIKELSLLNTLVSYTADVDISTNPTGNYYLKFITSRGVITKKVSINKLFR
jgi:type IX secretion system substrate protein